MFNFIKKMAGIQTDDTIETQSCGCEPISQTPRIASCCGPSARPVQNTDAQPSPAASTTPAASSCACGSARPPKESHS